MSNVTCVRNGFTLIEMLVFIAVFTLIVGVVSAFLLWTIRSNVKSRATRETIDNVRRALEVMTYEIRSARALYTPTFTATQLSLETATYLPVGETTSYIDIYKCDTRVCVKRETQEPFAITSEKTVVTNLSFRQIGTSTPAVEVALAVRYKNPSGRVEQQALVAATTTTALRGY